MRQVDIYLPENEKELTEIVGKSTLISQVGSPAEIFVYFGETESGIHEFLQQSEAIGNYYDSIYSIPAPINHMKFYHDNICILDFYGSTISFRDDKSSGRREFSLRKKFLEKLGIWMEPVEATN